MSEFQNEMTDILLDTISKDESIDWERSTYKTEHRCVHAKPYTYRYGRQDIYLELFPLCSAVPKKICIEIKSGVEDLRSGVGLNFTEDYNFLLFECGHGHSPIRMKHLKTDIPEHVGILVEIGGIIFCLRPAKIKSIPEPFRTLFQLGLGEMPKKRDLEDLIDNRL